MLRFGFGIKIVLTISLALLVVLVLAGTGAYMAMRSNITENTHKQMAAASDSFGHALTESFEDLVEELDSLSGQSIFGNALVDAAGRAIYLEPFLDRMRTIGGVKTRIFVTDFRGRVLADNANGLPPNVLPEWIAGVVETGRQKALVTNYEDQKVLVLAGPIIYVNTGLPEGALIFEIELSDILHRALEGRRIENLEWLNGTAISFDAPPNRIEVALGQRSAEALVWQTTLAAPLPLQPLTPMLSLFAKADVLEAPIGDLTRTFLGISAIFAICVMIISLLAGQILPGRLRGLSAQAKRLTASNDITHRFDSSGSDEVAALAQVLNELLDRLQASYEQLAETSAQDRERQRNRYLQVVEQAHDAIMIINPDGRISEANRAAHMITGMPEGKLVGTLLWDVAEGINGAEFRRMVKRIDEGQQETFTTLLDNGIGNKTPVEIYASSITMGDTRRILWVGRDISERVSAEEERAKLVQNLERSNAELQQFAYVASHDLQEPLRMISSYLGLLERRFGDQLDSDGREFIGYAIGGAKRMSSLIKDLLEYSRLQTRGKPMGPVPLEQALNSALQNLSLTIAETQTEIERPTSLPVVMGDDLQLASLFQNLISNAIKYHAPSRPPRIRIGIERQDQTWTLSVADNGIGIAPQFRDRIFLIFQRLHGQGTYEGTGIGLAAAKRIVERHNGTIWVESEEGLGSTFFFTLPVAVELQETAAQ